MVRTSVAQITYAPLASPTPEGELNALSAVYKFVLFDSQASKGGRYDLTKEVATQAEGVSKDRKGQDKNVCC
jgi:hypothetical protein